MFCQAMPSKGQPRGISTSEPNQIGLVHGSSISLNAIL